MKQTTLNPLNSFTDQELAALLKSGDVIAFELIYKKYWSKLLAVAGKRLNDISEAEEAIQDIFLNLWKRRETFELKVGFEHYFAVAVKFEVINRLAKRVRESNRDKLFAQDNEPVDPPFIRFDLELLEKQLENTINTLPAKCQLVFRMSRQDEYTNKKIAAELNISEKAVEKHITKALKVLRGRFGQYLTFLLFFF